MKTILLLVSFLYGTSFLFAQTKSSTDTIPEHLIPPPETISIILPIENPPVIIHPYPWPGEIITYPYQIPFTDWGNITVSLWVPQCGEQKHPNGRLSSRIECENGIQHGKSTFWDEKGHKTTEQYYIKGKQIGYRYWDDRGKLTTWVNYNGKGELHGKYFSYDAESGITQSTSYRNGIEHGLHKESSNGKLIFTEKYNMGDVVERTFFHSNNTIYERSKYYLGRELEFEQFYESGGLSNYRKNDTIGNRIIELSKNEDGVVIREIHYKNNQPDGIALDSYNDQSNIRITTEYSLGIPIISKEMSGDHLIRETKYSSGIHTSTVIYFENGDTSSLLIQGKHRLIKKWTKQGAVSDLYTLSNQNNTLTDTGFYTLNDTLYYYNAENKPDPKTPVLPIKRWTIFHGDTLRLDYVRNDAGMTTYNMNVILASNHFVKDPHSGRCLEDGIWKYYNGNNLSHVTTFKNGIREGRAIFYSSSDDPVVTSTGNFMNDIREGEWITYSENGNRIETYLNGQQTGPYTYYYPSGRVHVKGNMVNFKQEGLYQEFHENNVLKYECTYVNGNRYGNSRSFDEQGRISREGMVINNTAAGIWYFYNYAPDGTARRTKKKYSSRSELKRLSRQEEERQDQLKSGPIASL